MQKPERTVHMIEKPFILAGKKLSTRLVFPPLATESSDGGKPNEKSRSTTAPSQQTRTSA